MSSPVPPVESQPAEAAASGTSTASEVPTSTLEPSDQAVLDYLRAKGLGSAALELQSLLDKEPKEDSALSAKERLEKEDAEARNQRSLLSKSTGGGYGYDRDAAWPIAQWGVPDTGRPDLDPSPTAPMGVEEAKQYLDAFVSVQLWVLSLPDDDGGSQTISNPIARAKQLLSDSSTTLTSVIEELTKKRTEDKSKSLEYNLPPSAKPELLSVTFALLVHTYCELLEVGMETTAHTLRDAFKPVYDSLYGSEYRDLYLCTTVDDIVRLNSHNSQHMEALSSLKSILVQVASYQLRREELNAQATVGGAHLDRDQRGLRDQKIQEYDRNISVLKQRYTELSQRATLAFGKMHDLPFLRRARAVRWQLTLSNATYGLLAGFFHSKDESLLAMSTLLQTKCELHVERRDPLPFTPACVFDERGEGEPAVELNKIYINWAAPSALKEGEPGKELPYPRFHLEDEYDEEIQAARDKQAVEFNRALLINGFRRLEALERKRDFESLPESAQKRLKDGDQRPLAAANAREPSILLTTLCQSSSGPLLKPPSNATSTAVRAPGADVSSIWEEAGIGICCAKMSPPDGRRVAVGCDDSAIRIFDIMQEEPCEILLGHKNGFPVFDVDWNRDGRSLLSAGGDGSVRLWDTMAVGPFGEVAPVKPPSSAPAQTTDPSNKAGENTPLNESSKQEADMDVPGTRPEDAPYTNGAALAVYRGHVPSSPVWSVSFAPSGYYFASAGGDATARLWTTDRTTPMRLFVGHTAANVNCVEWHPNCNYVVTAGDDRTVRMWDIQTGRTVRLLDGCAAGVNTVKVSPGGRYVAGSDYTGVIHLWELGTGKKVTELRPKVTPKYGNTVGLVHRLTFSACGSTLASGGDDCCVKLWDVRNEALADKPIVATPIKSFPTRQTLLMDLQFTKRNLLLAVGKFVTPVPIASSEED